MRGVRNYFSVKNHRRPVTRLLRLTLRVTTRRVIIFGRRCSHSLKCTKTNNYLNNRYEADIYHSHNNLTERVGLRHNTLPQLKRRL